MIRFFIILLAAFVLPFLIYKLFDVVRTQESGPTPYAKLIASGSVLCILVCGYMWFLVVNSETPRQAYQPPRLENGEIRPGQFLDDEDKTETGNL